MEAKPESYDAFLEAMEEQIAVLHSLQQQAAQSCAPIVQEILHSRSRDVQQIEHTLDSLLDCAGTPEGLALFKTLCRYYYTLNPNAAAEYVNIYREMWDQEREVAHERA
ncbi:MAG TPA: hypothetical protein PLA50_15235 [Bacteroidia bacterium]|nr:hypothetical protein [Bacteroidia bacterium]